MSNLEQKVAELMGVNRRLLELDHAKKEFYRNISHELATPMTPIVGYLKLLIDGELGELQTPQRKALRAMDDCVQRLRRLIDALLDVTALETGKMRFAYREYDLSDLLREAISRQPAFDDGRLRLVADLPRRGTLTGDGDVERLGRGFDQLLDNAGKFTPAGGTVGIRARRLASGHLEICIADTGPGIPTEKARQLFEPFIRSTAPPRVARGTGIGLAIVRGVAYAMVATCGSHRRPPRRSWAYPSMARPFTWCCPSAPSRLRQTRSRHAIPWFEDLASRFRKTWPVPSLGFTEHRI